VKKEAERPMTILIIDDDERIRSLMRNILLFGGHRVIEASDGESGMRYLEGDRCDFVLTDLGMPGMNGWEVIKWIKTRVPQLPVALITGWGTDLDEKKIKESGVDWIIGKPFQVNEILEMVNLFKNRMETELERKNENLIRPRS
jgi:DNA-binding response OmpR family regulator